MVHSGLLVSMQSSLRLSYSVTQERERESANTLLAAFTHIRLVTYQDDGWKNVAGAHSMPFLIDFSVYEFESLGALDAIHEMFSL